MINLPKFSGGYINVYLNNKPEPYLSVFDPTPVSVKYVSFASFEFSPVEFLYNCVSDKSVIPEPVRTTSAPPTDDADLSEAAIDGKSTYITCNWTANQAFP